MHQERPRTAIRCPDPPPVVRRACVLRFAVFTLASLAAGFAESGGELIAARVVRGIGGAFLFANAVAIVTTRSRARSSGLAMGTSSMVGGVGLVIGPVLGGALVALSWHWVFWFNVPLGLLGTLWAAGGLAGLATLEVSSPYWVAALWLALVGVGSGVFNSPNTSAMMGVVPKNRRGVAAGTRTMLQNTGAVISISFVLAIVTAGIPKDVLFRIFSGLARGLPQQQVNLFIGNLHEAVLVLAAFSLLGALVSLLRPSHRPERAA